MKRNDWSWIYSLAVSALAFLLVACGGSGGGGSGTGTLSASITDSAVEELSEVNLRVVAIELRRQGGGANNNGNGTIMIDLRDPIDGSALEFNLLDYQHGATLPLFNDERVPAGDYVQARLIKRQPCG